jgi:hypothetical protein
VFRQNFLSYLANNPGKALPSWETFGTDYNTGHPIIQSLLAEGVIEWRKVPSASGKTMQSRLCLTEK